MPDSASGYILVEGEIGAGKTTLIESLAEQEGWIIVPEPVKEHPYLESYYEDPVRLAYMTQKWTQHMRGGAMFQAAVTARKNREVRILDRGLPGDWAFAYANWRLGNISDEGWALYQKDLENFWLVHEPPACIVHVETDTDTLLQRIRVRGRKMEAGITAEYLNLLKKGLELSLESYTKRFNVPIIHVDNNRWGDVNNLVLSVSSDSESEFVDTPCSELPGLILPHLMVQA